MENIFHAKVGSAESIFDYSHPQFFQFIKQNLKSNYEVFYVQVPNNFQTNSPNVQVLVDIIEGNKYVKINTSNTSLLNEIIQHVGARNRDHPIYICSIESMIHLDPNNEDSIEIKKRNMDIYYTKDYYLMEYVKSVKNCYHEFVGGTCFAPYLVMLQSSGAGKTRLLKEVATHLPTFYILCDNVQSLQASPFFVEMKAKLVDYKNVNSALSNDALLLGLVNIVAKYLIDGFIYFFKELKSKFTVSPTAVVSDLCKDIGNSIFKMDQNTTAAIQTAIATEAVESVENRIDYCLREYGTLMDMVFQEAKVFLFAFDEAEGLLENPKTVDLGIYVQAVRMASQLLVRLRIAVSLSGTNSNFQNFSPRLLNDPRAAGGPKLFPPFILKFEDNLVSGYVTSLKQRANVYPFICDRTKLHENAWFDRYSFFFLGRPMWKSMFYGTEQFNMDKLEDFIEKVVVKLKSTHRFDETWLAVLMSRISFGTRPDRTSAENLVKFSLATLTGTSEDRSMSYIEMSPETIVSIAAAWIFDRHKDFIIRKLCHYLNDYRQVEILGERGELVGQLHIIDILDFLTRSDKGPRIWESVNLSVFLKTLVGVENFQRFSSIVPENALISVIRFYSIYARFKSLKAKECLLRGLGYRPRAQNRGFDLAVPCALVGGGLFPLLFEIKNCQNEVDIEIAVKKWKNCWNNLVKKSGWGSKSDFLLVFVNFSGGVKASFPGNFFQIFKFTAEINPNDLNIISLIVDNSEDPRLKRKHPDSELINVVCLSVDYRYRDSKPADAFSFNEKYVDILSKFVPLEVRNPMDALAKEFDYFRLKNTDD